MKNIGCLQSVVVATVLVLLSSCSSPGGLSSSGKKVEILKDAPNSGCEVVGKVVGMDETGTVELARNSTRNQAAELDATHIRIDQEVPNGRKWAVYATAYLCE